MSSNTVFKFSIQIASTGPSQVIQVVCLLFLLFDFYQIVLKIPGIQSSDISLFTPYISYAVIALGLSLVILCGRPKSVNESVKTDIIVVLPLPDGPTNIKPCLTKAVSYN